MEKLKVDVLIIVPYTDKCEIIQKKIEIPSEYYESMKKYELAYNPFEKKNADTHKQKWDSDPFAHTEEK